MPNKAHYLSSPSLYHASTCYSVLEGRRHIIWNASPLAHRKPKAIISSHKQFTFPIHLEHFCSLINLLDLPGRQETCTDRQTFTIGISYLVSSPIWLLIPWNSNRHANRAQPLVVIGPSLKLFHAADGTGSLLMGRISSEQYRKISSFSQPSSFKALRLVILKS